MEKFTLIELWVVIATLAGMLLPALQKTRENERIKCLANMKRIGMQLMLCSLSVHESYIRQGGAAGRLSHEPDNVIKDNSKR